MPLVKKFIITLGVISIIFFGLSLLLPAKWEVRRSIDINAPAGKIFPYINDLHKWGLWYPWSKSGDVSLNVIYNGPDSGVGAIKQWSGSSVKNGKIEIIKSLQGKGIWYKFQSDESSLIVYGSLQIAENKGISKVTWEDTGDTGYSILARFSSGVLDSVIGAKFEQGLENLRKAIEK